MTTILRDFGHTKRCHTVRTVHTQTVAEHSHGVALLCAQLYGGKPSANLLLAALYHDLAESYTGDTPANVKWANKEVKSGLENEEFDFEINHNIRMYETLTEEERIVLKIADSLDLAFYCTDEMRFGNKHVNEMYFNITKYLHSYVPKSGLPNEIFERYREIFLELKCRYKSCQYASIKILDRMN